MRPRSVWPRSRSMWAFLLLFVYFNQFTEVDPPFTMTFDWKWLQCPPPLIHLACLQKDFVVVYLYIVVKDRQKARCGMVDRWSSLQ